MGQVISFYDTEMKEVIQVFVFHNDVERERTLKQMVISGRFKAFTGIEDKINIVHLIDIQEEGQPKVIIPKVLGTMQSYIEKYTQKEVRHEN